MFVTRAREIRCFRMRSTDILIPGSIGHVDRRFERTCVLMIVTRGLCSTRTATRVVYICHPFRSDWVANAVRVRDICRQFAHRRCLPLAPQIFLPHFLDEATERDRVMSLCLRLVALVDEVHVYGKPTKGMRLEIAEARRLGIPVVAGDRQGDLTLTGEPPR